MRKKFLVLALAAVLACGTCVTAFAAENDAAEATTEAGSGVIELTYDESAFDGEWTSFEGGFDLYIPKDWEEQEVTDEQAEQGTTFIAKSADGTLAMSVSASDSNLGEDATLDQIKEQASKAESLKVEDSYYSVNGIGCIGFTSAENENISGFMFLGESGTLYSVAVGPDTDDDSTKICTGILTSISPTEEDGAAEGDTAE